MVLKKKVTSKLCVDYEQLVPFSSWMIKLDILYELRGADLWECTVDTWVS